MTSLSFVRAAIRRARMAGDAEEVRRLLAALQALRKPENTLAPKDKETRD